VSSRTTSARRIARLLWPHLRPELPRLGLALAIGLVLAALGAAQPLLTRIVIDQGLIGRHFGRLLEACLGMLALALAGFALGLLHRLIYVRASGRALFALRGAAYAHLMRVSPRRLAERPVGDLVTRLDGDVAEVQRFGTDAVATLFGSLLTIGVTAAVMLALSWRLTLLVALLLPLQLGVRHYARAPLAASTRAVREAAGRVSGFLIETLAGARTVQGAGAGDAERARLGVLGEEYLARVLRAQLVGYGAGAAAGFLGNLVTAGIFVLGGWYVLQGSLSVGTLVAFVAYLTRSAGSAASLAGLYTGYQRARVSLERVEELLALPAVSEAADALPLPAEARGTLVLERVSLALPREGRMLLDAVSVAIPAGSKLVLRGASGAGKTTLTDLLRRFVEPESGRILLDGVPLGRYRLDALRRRVVVVEHSPLLVRGTILDNLRYGHWDVTEAAVLEAAMHAGVDDFVRELEHGYETLVGEGGAGLSTGQRQRIAIARAALADPLIVILDEALSGLDREAARAVQRALDDSFPARTRIVITHQATGTEEADLCWLLEAGTLRPAALGS
jgi:ATP-binding cassette subfamily B protein